MGVGGERAHTGLNPVCYGIPSGLAVGKGRCCDIIPTVAEMANRNHPPVKSDRLMSS